MNERYAWAGNGRGGEEFLNLLSGGSTASVVIALPPFEEANRTRSLAATIARALHAAGFAVATPDLPGTGDSLLPTAAARLEDWRTALAAAAAALPGRVHGVSVRAGALLDVDADLVSRWMLSPQGGASLVRELERQRQLGDGMVGGNAVADEMLAALATAEPAATGPLRTVRLASEAQPADRVVDAPPLWRRAEPDNDPALAALLADDIADWIAACEA